MTVLNEKVPINIRQMKMQILLEIDEVVENELYYIDNINNKIKNQLKKNIIKNMKEKINMDIFIYNIMDNNHCTYKHRRGKNEGKFCCKNITKKGNKKKYVCRTHNKDHIPEKKVKPLNDISSEDNSSTLNKKIEKMEKVGIRNDDEKNNNIIETTKNGDDDKNEIISEKVGIKNNEKNKNNNDLLLIKEKDRKRIKNKYINKNNLKINYINYENKKKIYNHNFKSNFCNNITLADFIPKYLLSY